MSTSTERYHSGNQSIIKMKVQSATVIKKGDFICHDAGNEYAIPAADVADAGDAAANREAAADAFIGISQSDSASGETDDISVDYSMEAIHELDLQSAAALSFGDLIEIYATTAACASQTTVAGATSPIAVCMYPKAASGTSFLAKLVPQKLLNTPQA